MERYENWIVRAKSSLEYAKVTKTPMIIYEDFCYQAQQAAEKALKGLLIFHHIEPEFTHNIAALIKELSIIIEIPENVKNAVNLTVYATQTRYPGQYEDLTKAEYEAAVKIATDCLEWVESQIKGSEEK
jgi:HEPN domain-containing protein